MALLVPYVGEQQLLTYMLNKASPTDPKLHLYTNNLTPSGSDNKVSYTESAATGYATATLTGSNWTITTNVGVTSATYAQQTFTYSAAEPNIYGYFVTDNTNTILLWAERFTDGPYAIPSGGGSVKVTPTIQLQ
jgi:hypothetical protein